MRKSRIFTSPRSAASQTSFGVIDLTTALTHSVNTVWAQVAEQVGKQKMASTMEKLGFNAEPPLLAQVFGKLEVAGIGTPLLGLVLSFTLGVLVTMVSALLPALRASRVAPIAALRGSRRSAPSPPPP